MFINDILGYIIKNPKDIYYISRIIIGISQLIIVYFYQNEYNDLPLPYLISTNLIDIIELRNVNLKYNNHLYQHHFIKAIGSYLIYSNYIPKYFSAVIFLMHCQSIFHDMLYYGSKLFGFFHYNIIKKILYFNILSHNLIPIIYGCFKPINESWFFLSCAIPVFFIDQDVYNKL